MRNGLKDGIEADRPIHVTRADAGLPPEGFLHSLLVEAQGFGDAADLALEDLLTALCEPVRRLATFRLRHHEDPCDMAEDVVQETLIRVAKGVRACHAVSDHQFLAWVRTIASNALTDMYRSPTSGMAAQLMAQDYHAEMKAFALDWQEVAARPSTPARSCLLGVVMDVYGDAPEATGEIFWLRLIGGLEWAEIAVRFNTTTAGAKRRFQRAQATLQREVLSRVTSLPNALRGDVQALLRSFDFDEFLADDPPRIAVTAAPRRRASWQGDRSAFPVCLEVACPKLGTVVARPSL